MIRRNLDAVAILLIGVVVLDWFLFWSAAWPRSRVVYAAAGGAYLLGIAVLGFGGGQWLVGRFETKEQGGRRISRGQRFVILVGPVVGIMIAQLLPHATWPVVVMGTGLAFVVGAYFPLADHHEKRSRSGRPAGTA